MAIDARIIAADNSFRIVKQVDGDKVTYIVELPDGFDALGVERWKDVSAEGKVVKAMRDFIIRAAVRGENDAKNQ